MALFLFTEKSFSGSPIDLTLEQTVNADAANEKKGIKSITNLIGARQHWAESSSLTLSRLWGTGGGGGRGSLWAVPKVESSGRARASSPEVYPAGKLQWHFTCRFDFRQSMIAICGRFCSPEGVQGGPSHSDIQQSLDEHWIHLVLALIKDIFSISQQENQHRRKLLRFFYQSIRPLARWDKSLLKNVGNG